MLNKILFASDLSERAERAGQRAAQLAEQFDAELGAVHVIESSFPGLSPAVSSSPDPVSILSAVAEQRLQESTPGYRATPRVLIGDTVGELVRAADEDNADLLVVGAHGKQQVKEWLLGTTAEQLVRHAETPTLVVRRDSEEPYQKIVMATDFSDCALAALHKAADWFAEAEMHIIHVLETEALDRMRAAGVSEDRVHQHYVKLHKEAQERLNSFVTEAGLAPEAVKLEVHAGHPKTVTVNAIETLDPDLVVLGNHGRGRWGNVLLGSLATRLLHELQTDILMVRD
ncbi:universal stress protein family 4 [Halorhodospira halochloris]|uniref:Universal stress protein family 4 n=1 Tax=Halorhodospira halochloris TaxID=1052 RepID=A0A0X8XAH8_HALHR|nr:universal stress protein [Halorhodospira halochloris]MBK1652128.1 hypothetical protein [Halorhodospira halochloris]MCG5547862.1 universal stress protein [Halorhodospira halochloris]BAU58454.1 universal stress protein family 4 [Halorhodospira halochloris]